MPIQSFCLICPYYSWKRKKANYKVNIQILIQIILTNSKPVSITQLGPDEYDKDDLPCSLTKVSYGQNLFVHKRIETGFLPNKYSWGTIWTDLYESRILSITIFGLLYLQNNLFYTHYRDKETSNRIAYSDLDVHTYWDQLK